MSTPLGSAEERLWRSLQRVLVALPRALHEDLLRSTGLSLSRYLVLMNLSEVDGHRMRMADLALATGLSASRITRLVETLRVQGLVVKRTPSTDARGSVAVLTEAGRQRLLGPIRPISPARADAPWTSSIPPWSRGRRRSCRRWPSHSLPGVAPAPTGRSELPSLSKELTNS